ncbi:MAG: MCE family protein [Phycisphaerales bacterium]|nr:MCE family protein [Phycisphaerales bacterium]
MGTARNNLIAGVFVVLGVLLAVWSSFLLADRSAYASTRDFIVRFTLSQGAMGLKRGSPVMLAGQEIGRVLDVSFDTPAGDGVPQAVHVLVEVRSDLTLYEDASINLVKPLLGSLSSININAVGTPQALATGKGPQIEKGEIIQGRIAPPGFLEDAGLGPEQSAQIKSAIASIDTGVKKINDLIERTGPGVEASVSDARAVLADLRKSIAEWSKQLDTTMANVEAASAKLDPIMAKAEAGLDDARGVVASIQGMIDENRARVNETVKSLESAAAKIDQKTVEDLNAALAEGRGALNVFSEAVSKVSGVVGEQTPNLRRTLANLRLMSDQLKLTAVEIRSQPWRLLHQPTSKEFESQVLYDATRSYAEAASDLKAASESLEAAAALHEAGRPDAPDLAPLTQSLSESLAAYRQVERYLFDKLAEKERK